MKNSSLSRINLKSQLLFTSSFLLISVCLLFPAISSNASNSTKPIIIDAGTGDGFRTDIKFDNKGNALAVFEQKSEGVSRIFFNKFNATPSTSGVKIEDGWQGAVPIDAGLGDAYFARIAIDDSDNAIAIFKQHNGKHYGIYANRYLKDKGWQGTVPIDAGTGDADGEQIAFDSKGNAVAVYEQKLGGVYRIFVNQYLADKGWQGPVLISNPGTVSGSAYFPYPAFDNAGNLFVIYYQKEGHGLETYVRRYIQANNYWEKSTRLTNGKTVEKIEDWANKKESVIRGVSGIYNPRFLDKLDERIYSGTYSYQKWGFETPSNMDARFRAAYRPSLVVDKQGDILSFFLKWDGNHLRGYTSVYRTDKASEVLEKKWSVPELIDAGEGDVEHLRVDVNSEGKIGLAFVQWTNNNIRVHSRIYTPSEGWGEVKIVDRGKKDAFGPNLVYTANNELIVVWCQWAKVTVKTFKNIFRKGEGWEGASQLDNEDGPVCGERIAADKHGRVMAIYEKMKAKKSDRSIINALELGSPIWKKPIIIDAGKTNASRPSPAFDSNGNAIVIFEQEKDGFKRMYANRYNAKTTVWEGAVLIDAGPKNAYLGRLAFDKNNNAIALFKQNDGKNYRIYANRYITGSGWLGPEAIDAGTGDADGHLIAFDKNGNAAAVFEQNTGGVFRIYSNRYIAGKGWQGAVMISNSKSTTGNAYFPYLSFDNSGNLFVIFYQMEGDGLETYVSNYSMANKKWNVAVRVTSGETITKSEDWNIKKAMIKRGVSGIYNPQFFDELKKRIYAGSYNYSGFETPANVDARFRDAYRPSLIVDKEGLLRAFYLKWNGSHLRGYTATLGGGKNPNNWDQPRLIDAEGGGDVEHMRVVKNSEGELVLVFAQWNGGNIRIHSRTFKDSWGDVETIDSGNRDAYSPHIVFNGKNEIGVIFCQWIGSLNTVTLYRNIYKKGKGWGKASPLPLGEHGYTCGERIAAGPDGRIISVVEVRVASPDKTRVFALDIYRSL